MNLNALTTSVNTKIFSRFQFKTAKYFWIFLFATFPLLVHTQAKSGEWNFTNQSIPAAAWFRDADENVVAKNGWAILCSFYGTSIYAPGEKVKCYLGTVWGVNLDDRIIYYDSATRRDPAWERILHKELEGSGYVRLEVLRAELVAAKEEDEKIHLERLKAEKADKDAKEVIEQQILYTKEFDSAKTLEAIVAFENHYKENDPENLIPKLAPLKLQLETKQYQDRFAAAKSSSELQSFITTYESNDPDALTPQAKRRLAIALKTEQAEQVKADREKAEIEKRLELEKLASPVVNCNRITAQAFAAIQREKEIASVSGYENKQVLRQAGEYIVSCRKMVTNAYAAYRKAGGTKALSELK